MKLVKPDQLHIIRPMQNWIRQGSRAFSRSVTKTNNPTAITPGTTSPPSIPAGVTTFLDSQFRLLNETAQSKQLSFNCATIPASTLVTVTIPTTSGTMAYTTTPPAAHALSHKSGGSDQLLLDELGSPTDVTTLNASTATHGLLRKLDNDTTHFLRGDGAWAVATIAPVAVDLTGQTASITTTNIVASTAQAGMYRATAYIKVTTAGNALDTIVAYVGWNDGTVQYAAVPLFDSLSGTPQTVQSLQTINSFYWGTVEFYSAAAQAITYSTSVVQIGNPAYTLRIRLELIG